MEHSLYCAECDEDFRVFVKSKTAVEFCPLCGTVIVDEDDDLRDADDDDDDEDEIFDYDDDEDTDEDEE